MATSVVGCGSTPRASVTDPADEAVTAAAADPALDVIAFASCFRGGDDPSVWNAILAQDPDLFLFIGDNVYVDIKKGIFS